MRWDDRSATRFWNILHINYVSVARRRRPAEAQCTRSLRLGYKLRVVIPVAGQRTHGTTFRALKVTYQVATQGAVRAVYDCLVFLRDLVDTTFRLFWLRRIERVVTCPYQRTAEVYTLCKIHVIRYVATNCARRANDIWTVSFSHSRDVIRATKFGNGSLGLLYDIDVKNVFYVFYFSHVFNVF